MKYILQHEVVECESENESPTVDLPKGCKVLKFWQQEVEEVREKRVFYRSIILPMVFIRVQRKM